MVNNLYIALPTFLLYPMLRYLVPLAACLAACESSPTAAAGEAAAPTSNPATAMSEAAAPDQAAPAQAPYRLLGVYDPGLKMLAWAMKVPRDWQVQQSYEREWNGSLPHDKVYLRFNSPDGAQQIEYLPYRQYVFSDGPAQQQMHAQMQAAGFQPPRRPNELAPMPALAYLKQVLMPQLTQQGLPLRSLGNERQTSPQPDGQSTRSTASIDGVLPNGRKVRVECRVWMKPPMRNGTDVGYAWGVVPSITQTSGELAATYAHTRVAQESITNNPAWLRRNQELSDRGLQANVATMKQNDADFQAAMRHNHEARMAGIARVGAITTARHNERMAAMDQKMAEYQANSTSRDRQHEYYLDNVVRGETKMVNPGTGERVKLDNTYQHSYTDNQGHYYQSNTPINAGSLNWQELQQVTLKNY